MAYVRPIKFEPGQFLRPCDTCGIRFRANELVRGSDGHFRCRRWCAEQTQLDRDRIAAASDRRREAPPPPYGVPYTFGDAYEQEGILFNFLANQPVVDPGWPGGRRLGAAPGTVFRPMGWAQLSATTRTAISGGETMRYLYQIIVENQRPTSWITRARQKLGELGDWIIRQQDGFGINPTDTKSNSGSFGSVPLGNRTLLAADHGRLGLGQVYAYQILGDAKYLASARAIADFITNLQQGGLLTSNFSSSDAAGTTPVNYGTWSRSVDFVGISFEHVYQADSLVCLEFLQALMAVTGDELHGADTTLFGTYTQAPQQLLSVSMANARAFWQVGAFDSYTGTTLTGLSSTTPRELFNSYPVVKPGWSPGSGAWEFQDGPAATGTLITAVYLAAALRALYSYEGLSANVANVWSWLMGFTSNPAYQPTTTSLSQDEPAALGIAGTYNPKLSLSSLLQVRTTGGAATAMNGSSVYDFRCAGYLSPIQRVQDPGSLDLAKDFVTKGALVLPTDYDNTLSGNGTTYFMVTGQSGLGGQVVQS
jgi:hypothetical protein